MAISLTLTVYNAPYGIDQTNTRMWLRGKAVFTAGNYAAGGQPYVAPPFLDASGQVVLIPTLNLLPDELKLESVSGSGYIYVYNHSTAKVQVFEVGSGSPPLPLAELPAAALPAGVVNDVIEFVATWAKS